VASPELDAKQIFERLAVVEAGVPTAEIDTRARQHGLFYAPDPGSARYSHIGGNLATGAAGPRAVKYGGTRDHVLGLRAVTGDGRTLVTGCRTTKGVVGYDLTRLLVGSEGTLALITEATLKLLPAPSTTGTLRAPSTRSSSMASGRAETLIDSYSTPRPERNSLTLTQLEHPGRQYTLSVWASMARF